MFIVHPDFVNHQYSAERYARARFWLGVVLYANASRYARRLTVVLANLNVSLSYIRSKL